MLPTRAPRRCVINDVQRSVEDAARRQLAERAVLLAGATPVLRRCDELLPFSVEFVCGRGGNRCLSKSRLLSLNSRWYCSTTHRNSRTS
eukprot:2962892-Prymnesium_polylepis.1